MAATIQDKPTPLSRFLALLASEKKTIGYIYIYAIFSGLINLSLPLGIQSLIGFVSGGQMVTSVSVLVFLIIVGVLVVGGLQVMLLSLVELIQQRIFAKTSFRYASHLIQLRGDQAFSHDLPELMNRFFDVISLQKGLAKLLTDFSAAAIQIIFGLILLSFYHPYFIFFGLMLIAILVLVLRLSGPKGMKTSLEESKYKYRLVHWLEEVARAIPIFKTTGNDNLALEKTDYYTSGYLKARKAHFRVLISQYISFVGFKTFITAGLLLMGSFLLLNQEINLGQFVASEIIIILTINAVEKLLVKLDSVYDVLTSVEKIGAVTDLPVLDSPGTVLETPQSAKGVHLQLKQVSYQYPDRGQPTIQDVSLQISGSQKICLSGSEGSGRTTLLRIAAGLLPEYTGTVIYNGLPLKNVHPAVFYDQVSACLSLHPLFDGTIWQNIVMGHPDIKAETVLWALDCVELTEYVQSLPEGFHTHIRSNAPEISPAVAQQLALARCIVRKPSLLLLDQFLPEVDKPVRDRIAQKIVGPHAPWAVLVASNEPEIRQLCEKNLLMLDGRLVREIAPDEEIFEELLLNKM